MRASPNTRANFQSLEWAPKCTNLRGRWGLSCAAPAVLRRHSSQLLSRWLDYWYQKLKLSITACIKDSAQLLQKLRAIKQLPEKYWLFTADTKSMYTNIDTNHALATISQWLDSITLPGGFPLAAGKSPWNLSCATTYLSWETATSSNYLAQPWAHLPHACGLRYILQSMKCHLSSKNLTKNCCYFWNSLMTQ